MRSQDVTNVAFSMAAFAFVVWWNVDWRRFIKFYEIIIPNNPQYRRWMEIGIRVFWAFCLMGVGRDLWRLLFLTTRPGEFYRQALLLAAMWFASIILLVKTVEWLASKRKRKSPIPR